MSNWSWQVTFPLREYLFVVHRVSGIAAGIAALIWMRERLVPLMSVTTGRLVKGFHAVLATAVAALAGTAWYGRALDGRWAELYSLMPLYNFVSRPDTPLAHSLLHFHTWFAYWLASACAIHTVFGLLHAFNTRNDVR